MNLLGVLAKMGSMTMVSRILGFVRDAVLARIFGAGMAMDAFVVAFRLPNLLRRIFAEGAFAQAFIPVLAEYKEKQSPEATREFVQYVAGMLIFALVVIKAIGIMAAPWVIWLTATGWAAEGGERFELAVSLLRVVFPYILLISLSSFVGSILNTYGRFAIPAFTPTLLNISFIVFALFFVPYFDPPIMALAWAVFVGGVLQLIFQLPYLFKLGFLHWPKLKFRDVAVNRVMKQMLPAVVSSSATQISLVINTIFASFLVAGSMSWMYYADRLLELPSGVIGAALGTILLPSLSKHAAMDDRVAFSALLDWGLRLCVLLILPAAVGLAVLAFPLVATLFMYREFTVHDAQMTQYALMVAAIGLPAMMFVRVLAPGFFARKDVRTPMKIALISIVCTQVFNGLLVWNWQHIGLTAAYALGACVNAILLFKSLYSNGFYQPSKGWKRFLLQTSMALMVMILGLVLAQWQLPLQWEAVGWLRAIQLGGLIVLAMILYFGTLIAVGIRPRDFKRSEKI